MKKIPCLFQRDFTDRRHPKLLREVTPGCEWVIAGEGFPTRKFDGQACAVIDGQLHTRYDAKAGKTAPPGAIPCGDPDPVTGHHPHWVKADRPEDRWVRACLTDVQLPDGTYEACGPKINGNNENLKSHIFFRHGDWVLSFAPRTYDELFKYFEHMEIEGIVFHHQDGRMVKIRRDDFGLPWPVKKDDRG